MTVEPENTTIFRVCADGTREPMWSITSWLRWVYVSNDGQRLVENPSGGLLSGDAAPGGSAPPALMQDAALIIHGPTGIVRVLRVGDVLDSPGDIQETTSNWSWGDAELAENDVIVTSGPFTGSTSDDGADRGTKLFRASDGTRITQEQARSIPTPEVRRCTTATSTRGACAPRCSLGASAPSEWWPWWQGCLLLVVQRLRRRSGRGRPDHRVVRSCAWCAAMSRRPSGDST
jgi:hypothetical protein